jgi:hypothetical protein
MALAQIADLGPLDARLVKVSDDGRMLCLFKIAGLNGRFFVHSVERGQTKQVRFPDAIQELGIAVLGNTVFVASSGSGPLYQYDFISELLSEFRPAGLPVDSTSKWLPTLSYPRTHFNEPGVLFFTYGTLEYFRWTQSSGELKELQDFSYCMTADGNHVWLGDRSWNSYPLLISSVSELPSINSDRERPKRRVITNFKFPGGRSCHLDQLSPCGEYALISVQSGGQGIYPGDIAEYIVNLSNGRTRMLLRNGYATLRQDLGNVSRVFWVKN